MKTYGNAVRDWFYPEASIPSGYGGGYVMEPEQTQEFKKHVRRCGLVWVTEPGVRTMALNCYGDDEVLGVTATVGCKCKKYGPESYGRPVVLFISGKSLIEGFLAKIAEGEK